MDDADGTDSFVSRHCSKTGSDDNMGDCETQCCSKTGGNENIEHIKTKTQCCFLTATNSVCKLIDKHKTRTTAFP